MTTKEFIRKNFDNVTVGKNCSSVYVDSTGEVFSYGNHYILLFKVNGHTFINTRGYSNTTAKHIGWAWSAVDYNATAVELTEDESKSIVWNRDTDHRLMVLKQATERMVIEAQKACDAKKRKDTQVYKWLADTLGRAMASNIAVRNLMGTN